MSPVSETQPHYYIPHLAVIKLDSLTTKTRIVFNASSKTTNGRSLNDCLLIAPTLQRDVVEKKVSFHMLKLVFVCDIVKMYRQINAHADDWNFQRFVWRRAGKIVDCGLTTVTFGTASAPFTAVRTLVQLAEDRRGEFPIGAQILSRNAYVDDLPYGSDSVKRGAAA